MTTTTSPRTSKRSPWPEWVGSWPRLTGRQTPEFESKFDGDESDGDRCGRFGARIGLRQMPWQWLVLRATLSLLAPNEWGERLWVHRSVCIECTRQNGKTLIIVLRILFGLFVLREKRIVYTAQRWSTAEDVFDRVIIVINRVPSLKRRLAEKPSKKDNRGVIRLTNGAKAEFGPRSQDFGRGYTEIDLVFFDEAYDLDEVPEKNLTGAQRAAKNPQTWYVSTPPVAAVHPKSQKLAGLHRLGHARAPGLYYVLFAAPRTLDRMDPDAWPLANPSYGVVGDDREMQDTLQKARTTTDRAIADADYLGWGDYPPEETDSTSPIDADQWTSMEVDEVQLTGHRAIALERTRDRKTWAVAAAQWTIDDRIFVEIGYSRAAANGEIVKWVVAATTILNPVALAIDQKSAAAVLKPDLLAAGVEPTMTTTAQLALASGGFLDDALAGRLAHTGQDVLRGAVAAASMRELPGGGFTWDEAYGGDSAAQLKAATLARWALVEFGQPTTTPGRPSYDRASDASSSARDRVMTAPHFDPMIANF